MKFARYHKKLNLTLVSFVMLAACAVSPLGRKQLLLMPDSQMTQMGDQSFVEIKKQYPSSKKALSIRLVRCVSEALLENVEGTKASEWDIQVFESKAVNAFALPGKNIGVFTGLLKVAKTPDQLAAVVAHEIGHVLANHGNERVSTALAAQGGLAAADAIFDRKKEDPTRNLLMAALGLGVQVGIQLPFSRRQETESDLIGLTLMAKSGFYPSAAIELWNNMRELSSDQPPEFLSTHPSHQSRIQRLDNNMSKANDLYARAVKKDRCRSF